MPSTPTLPAANLLLRAAGLRAAWPEGPSTCTEDDLRCEPALGAVVLAEGRGAIGGQGRPASKLVVWSVIGELQACSNPDRRACLRASLERAGEAVRRLSGTWQPGLIKPFATGAVLALEGAQALVGHLGNCRISLLRDGLLQPLTRDHALVLGATASAPSGRVILTRAFGGSEPAEVTQIAVRPGDLFLLATSTVHRLWSDTDLAASLSGAEDDLEAACARLLAEVTRRAPSPGTASVCLARVEVIAPGQPAASSGASHRPPISWLFAPGAPLPAVPVEHLGPDQRWFREVFYSVMGEDNSCP